VDGLHASPPSLSRSACSPSASREKMSNSSTMSPSTSTTVKTNKNGLDALAERINALLPPEKPT
jgi:hypothetical protein